MYFFCADHLRILLVYLSITAQDLCIKNNTFFAGWTSMLHIHFPIFYANYRRKLCGQRDTMILCTLQNYCRIFKLDPFLPIRNLLIQCLSKGQRGVVGARCVIGAGRSGLGLLCWLSKLGRAGRNAPELVCYEKQGDSSTLSTATALFYCSRLVLSPLLKEILPGKQMKILL